MCVRRFWDPAPDVWGLWVPKTSVPSRDLLIFVDQASEQAGTSHLLWWWSVGVCRAVGWSLAECAVWPMGVVVPEVGSQDCGEVVAAEDEDPIGALAADGADPAFGESVRPGRAHRGANDRDLFGGEDGIEAGDELGVSIADQKTQLFDPITDVHATVGPSDVGPDRSQPGGGSATRSMASPGARAVQAHRGCVGSPSQGSQ
jgi:hypothetical protein